MERKQFWFFPLLLLALSVPASADWLGLMNSGYPIDVADFNMPSQSCDIAFDQENNGISVITQCKNTEGKYSLLQARQSYGADAWAANATSIEDTDLGGTVNDPSLSILPSGWGMCVYSQQVTTIIPSYYRIYGRQYNGTVGTSFTTIIGSNHLDPDPNNDAFQPSVVAVRDSLAIMTFVQKSELVAGKWENGAYKYWNGAWATTGSAERIDGYEAGAVTNPHLVCNHAQDVYCAVSKSNKIFVSRYRNQRW